MGFRRFDCADSASSVGEISDSEDATAGACPFANKVKTTSRRRNFILPVVSHSCPATSPACGLLMVNRANHIIPWCRSQQESHHGLQDYVSQLVETALHMRRRR